ncbi:hypothetical protein Goklo_014409, partial [Gossypium klotzschianum]|nr:hypothetical protein [Gossypium klotzschianum]
MKEVFPNKVLDPNVEKETLPSISTLVDSMIANEGKREVGGSYRPWMLVKKNSRCKSRELRVIGAGNQMRKFEGSRFSALIYLDNDMDELGDGDKNLGGQAYNKLGLKGNVGPSGQLKKVSLVTIGSLGSKRVVTLMNNRGKKTLQVNVDEIVCEEFPDATGVAAV